jgi:hypothetical protein
VPVRVVHLGALVAFTRSTSGEPDLVVPDVILTDPNSDPILFTVVLPDYDAGFLPLLEVHLIMLPKGTPEPTAQTMLDDVGRFPHRVWANIRGTKGKAIMMGLGGLPAGSWYFRPVLISGAD